MTKDPRTNFEVYGYIYNPTTGLKESYIDALELTIEGNSFVLERGLIHNQAIKTLNCKLDKQKIAVNNRLPKIYLTFSTWDIGTSIKVSNNNNIDPKLTGRYELEGCLINTIEVKVMIGRRFLCLRAEGLFDSIKYYEESYNDFINKQYS